MSSIVKIGIALLLFWAVLSSSDWNSVIVHFTNLDLTIIALLVAITLAQAAVLAVRWRAIAKPSFPEFTFRSSFAGTLISFFFSQGLPSSIGGDAFRIWWVRRNGVALSEATAYVMFDRVVGLLSLLILCAFSLALLGARANQETYAVMSSVLATTILAGLVCAAILMYPKRLGVSDRATAFAARCPAWLGTLITLLVSIRKISVGYTRNVFQFLGLLSMGVGVHLMTVYIGYIVATELLDTISFADCLAVVAPALLIS